MKKRNITHKDIMKRLEELEKRTEITSAAYLFFSIAIALLLFSFVSQDAFYLVLGIACYIIGMSINKFKHYFVDKKKN